MIDIEAIRAHAKPGDAILLGGNSFLSKLIRNGQRVQTIDGKPSRWSHIAAYHDSDTVVESTMDYDHYLPTGKRLDNGPQYNDMATLEHKDYGVLLCLTALTNEQRQAMLNEAQRIIESGAYRYDVSGLFGSLLTYWFMPWSKSNPLSKKNQMYCSAFYSDLLNCIGIDPCRNTDRNTSPEQIWRWQMNISWIKPINVTKGGQ